MVIPQETLLRLQGLVSLSPCLLVSLSPCLRVSVSPCLRVSVSPCLRVSVSPCLLFSLSPCLPIQRKERESNPQRLVASPGFEPGAIANWLALPFARRDS